MTWEEVKVVFKNKIFLIGLTFTDEEGQMIEQYQTSGSVKELTDEGLFLFKRADGSIFQLPFDPDAINEAPEGEYKAKGTGVTVVNPDYITIWEIEVSKDDNLEEMKQKGFVL